MAFPGCPRRHVTLGLAPLAGALALATLGCEHGVAHAPEKKAPEVVITSPVGYEVADYQDFTGRLDGLRTIEIRARVSGFILSAPFKEGDLVREGDLLFQIDPQPYQADLNLAQANVKLAEADQTLQKRISARARVLIGSKAIAQEDYDTAVATWEKSQATTQAMGATRDRARLYRDYTRVIAPFSGRISRRSVDPGNLVNADSTLLTTIVRDDQLYAYFDVDERTYLDLVSPSAPGASTSLAKLEFPVLLRLANEEDFSRSGVVNFVDNRVNASTGTIRMRAVIDNPANVLRSGLFVRIRLPIGEPYPTLLIPDEAVLSDQGRKYVYLVDDKDEVVYRTVTPGQEIQGLRAIKKGLAKGDHVIISGMQRVKAGVQVHADIQAPPKPPNSPLGKLLALHGPAPAPRLPGKSQEQAHTSAAGKGEAKGQ
jgi:RND family efflux transporter MFP subunit